MDRGLRTDIRDPRIEDQGSGIKVRGPRIEDRGKWIEDRGSRTEDRGSRTKHRGSRLEYRRSSSCEGRKSRIENRGSRFEVGRSTIGRVRAGLAGTPGTSSERMRPERTKRDPPPPNYFETGPTRIPATSPERMWPEQARWNGRRRNARGDTPLSQTSSGHVYRRPRGEFGTDVAATDGRNRLSWGSGNPRSLRGAPEKAHRLSIWGAGKHPRTTTPCAKPMGPLGVPSWGPFETSREPREGVKGAPRGPRGRYNSGPRVLYASGVQ